MSSQQLQFQCPHCAQPMLADVEDVGAAVDCPNCAAEVVIPAPPPPAAGDWFEFGCPACGERMAANPTDVGAIAACPACGTEFEIPDPQTVFAIGSSTDAANATAEIPDDFSWDGDDAPPPAPTLASTSASESAASSEFEFSCPKCGSLLAAELSDIGGEVDCPQCGHAFPIPDPRDPLQILAQLNAAALADLPSTPKPKSPPSPSATDALIPPGLEWTDEEMSANDTIVDPLEFSNLAAAVAAAAGEGAAASSAPNEDGWDVEPQPAAESEPAPDDGWGTETEMRAAQSESAGSVDSLPATVGPGSTGSDMAASDPGFSTDPHLPASAAQPPANPASEVKDADLASLVSSAADAPTEEEEADALLAALMDEEIDAVMNADGDGDGDALSATATQRVGQPHLAPSTFDFDCQHCGEVIVANVSAVGSMVNCPSCHSMQPIPAPIDDDAGFETDESAAVDFSGDDSGDADLLGDEIAGEIAADREPEPEELSKDAVRQIHRGMLKKAGPFFANIEGIEVAIHKAKPKEAPLLFALCFRPTPLLFGFTQHHVLVSFPEERKLVLLRPQEVWLATKFKKTKPPADPESGEPGKPGSVSVRAYKLDGKGGKELVGEMAFEFFDGEPEGRTAVRIKKLVKPWMESHPFIQAAKKRTAETTRHEPPLTD